MLGPLERYIFGSGEKSYKYVGFRYVISIKSLVFLGTLTYLIRDVRDVIRDVRDVNLPYKGLFELYSLL